MPFARILPVVEAFLLLNSQECSCCLMKEDLLLPKEWV